MPCRAQNALVNAFDPSSRAAAALGPNALIPAAPSRSTSPRTKGTSGPTTTSPAPSARASATSPAMSSAWTGTQRASAAMPALPGAHKSSLTSGEAASAQHNACSRPPEPTTSTFIRNLPASQRGPLSLARAPRHVRPSAAARAEA